MADVYLNNKLIGEVENPKEFVEKIVSARRKGDMSTNLNVRYDENRNDILIEVLRGRVRRPLIVVKGGESLFTQKHVSQLEKNEISFMDLVSQGVIEYLDAEEEENAYVSFYKSDLTKEHTHLEIAPIAMLGLCSSLVPYANYSPGARVSMGSKNQKQGIGFYATNFSVRMDMDVNLLHSPQRPIVQTVMHNISSFDDHASGQNVIVAVMSYKGYNMDDSIIINKGSIERGYARSTYYRPEMAEELRYAGGLMDEINVPDKEVRGYRTEHDYRFLDDDGIISPECEVEEGDVIIGKSSPPRFLNSMDEYNLATNIRRESSVSIKHGEQGTVDFVLVTENEEGNKIVQVRLREQKIPEVGDKFTSRHRQKGVVGLIIPNQDMPFSARGTVPDIMFSPHGIPSRMTISHLIELVSGKTGALSGRYIDGTTFDAESEFDTRKELERMGFRENGTEILYNGETGEQFEARIYIGNMYYLRLKHMVSNKMHSRARGPIQLLTRQPTEGRAKEGGLRLGEMEKDTFVAHGASQLLKERFDSDKIIIPICEKSGLVGYIDARKDKPISPIYGEDSEMSFVEVSYAFKLFLDELKSLGIYPKLKLANKF